jgi:hypothetical protein
MVFFAYSALIGVFAVVLSLAVQRRQREDAGPPAELANPRQTQGIRS